MTNHTNQYLLTNKRNEQVISDFFLRQKWNLMIGTHSYFVENYAGTPWSYTSFYGDGILNIRATPAKVI